MSLLDKPFRIEFTNPEKIYQPGDIIEGKIIFLWIGHVKAIQGITAKLRCYGKIHSGKVLVDSLYEQTYYSKKYHVFGDGIHWVQVPRGGTYPFRFTLPSSGLPQSFQGSHGCIKYLIHVIATIKIKRLGAIRVDGDEQFNVNDVRVISNEISSTGGPFEMLFDESRSSFSIRRLSSKSNSHSHSTSPSPAASPATGGTNRRSSDTKIKLSVNKKGFVAGEFVQFSVQVVNESRKSLPAATVEFQQVIKYISPHLTRQEINNLGKSDGNSTEPKSNSTWESYFEVPIVPVSSLPNSTACIQISYRLKIEIVTSPLTRNMKYYCPIIIGSRTLSPTRDSREETLDLHELDNLIEQELVNGFNEDFALRIEHRPSTSSCPPGPCPNYADIAAAGWGSFISIGPPPSYEDVIKNQL